MQLKIYCYQCQSITSESTQAIGYWLSKVFCSTMLREADRLVAYIGYYIWSYFFLLAFMFLWFFCTEFCYFLFFFAFYTFIIFSLLFISFSLKANMLQACSARKSHTLLHPHVSEEGLQRVEAFWAEEPGVLWVPHHHVCLIRHLCEYLGDFVFLCLIQHLLVRNQHPLGKKLIYFKYILSCYCKANCHFLT